MSSLQPISLHPSSEEFGITEFMLQLQLNSPHLSISECFDISSRTVKETFTSQVSSMPLVNLVDVFIPVSMLNQPISDIQAHGVRVNPKTGLRFQVGSFQIDRTKDSFEVIHVVVALGKVINNQKPGIGIDEIIFSNVPPTPAILEDEYNSVRVSDNSEFVVFNPNQISAQKLVRFVGGDNISTDPVVKHICSNCEKDNAAIWCDNDNCMLCKKCDEEGHKTKLTQCHVRRPLNEALVLNQKCQFHTDQVAQYYCQKCHLPVCLECKVKGNHAKGEPSKHPLVDLSKALDAANQKMSKPDPLFVTREKELREQIEIAANKITEILEVEKQTEAEIMRIANKAIEEARSVSSKRALIAKSAKSELLRKMEDLKIHKSIIEAHYHYSEPLPFLQAFYRNQSIESGFADNLDIPESASIINARLVVSGHLDIVKPHSEPPVLGRGMPVTDLIDESSAAEANERDIEEPDPHITTLSRMAQRKQDKYDANGINLDFQPFEGSAIISDPQVAKRLYLCFPFKGQPITHRMFFSEVDGRNVSKIHRIVDGHGITAILVKSGEHVFGGFAASKWNQDGKNFGKGSTSFIFQINKDAFIPNRGQTEEPICLYATPDSITFGKYDLALVGNLEKCFSTIENSYGVGFSYGSEKAKTFLVGAPEFRADLVEIWGFYASRE